MLKNLEKEGTGDRVESPSNIKLELVQASCHLLDEKEVVMHATASDECAFVSGDNFPHPWNKTQGEHLGEQLGEQVYEADRSILGKRGGFQMLGKKGEESFIQLAEKMAYQ